MSYYESRVEENRAAGAEVRELGDEGAVGDGAFALVGGDAPVAYELSGVTDAQARRLAELGRAVDGEAAWREYMEEIGAREIPWS